MFYKKKPVVIEAIQFDGTLESYDEIGNHFGMDNGPFVLDAFDIKTLEGRLKCSKGDWVIKGIKGEFYPCKPDIFEATYEEAKSGT
jgi:hypothetical protein